MSKWKRTNNDVQNTTQEANDRATRTPLKPEGGYTATLNIEILMYITKFTFYLVYWTVKDTSYTLKSQTDLLWSIAILIINIGKS